MVSSTKEFADRIVEWLAGGTPLDETARQHLTIILAERDADLARLARAQAILDTLKDVKENKPIDSTYWWMHKLADAERNLREASTRPTAREGQAEASPEGMAGK